MADKNIEVTAAVNANDVLSAALALSDTCKYLAILCIIVAAACTVAGWLTRPKEAVKTTIDSVKGLAGSAGFAPAAIDIPKVIDSAKGVVDSLSKASPLVAWLAASVFFMVIAVFGVSDYAHKAPTPPAENPIEVPPPK